MRCETFKYYQYSIVPLEANYPSRVVSGAGFCGIISSNPPPLLNPNSQFPPYSLLFRSTHPRR